PQREAVAKRRDGVALDRRRHDGGSQRLPSIESLQAPANSQSLRLQLINPSTSPNELNTTLTPHSIIHGDACFAYFNKIWDIPEAVAAIVVIVVIALKVHISWQTLLLIPGIMIVAVNGAWMTILFGMVSARFRDVPPLVGNIIQILMFVTPIFWFSSQLGPGAQPIITYNFMYHLVEVMRGPMLGTAPSLLSYAFTIAGAIIGWVVTFDLYARF